MSAAGSEPVLVVGGGVAGLSCGVRLQEAGFRVRIVADRPPEETTSAVAAAIWYPYLPEGDESARERLLGWARAGYTEFQRLAGTESSGVRSVPGIELFPSATGAPWWIEAVPGLRRARPDELPPSRSDGFVFEVPVIEMPIYLPWLRARFAERGGAFEVRRVESLEDELETCAVLINCSGLGARELAHDSSMFAIRGQTVRVERSGTGRFVLDEHAEGGLVYIVPRSQDVVLGGTVEPRREDLEADPDEASAIVARCAAYEPALATARKLGDKVGLRPGRPSVRLEIEEGPSGKLLVHNYGHSGAGVTLSWGCADEVTDLVRAHIDATRGTGR